MAMLQKASKGKKSKAKAPASKTPASAAKPTTTPAKSPAVTKSEVIEISKEERNRLDRK